MKNSLCFFLVFIALASCRPNPETAHWEVDSYLPIFETRLDIMDFNLNDTVLQTNANGQIEIVLKRPLVSLKPGAIAPPFNETFSNTANLQKIDLGQRVISERISLGSIAAGAGLNGALLIAANGTNQVIPALSNIGPSNFNIDATQFFQSMTLKDGWLVLRMENNFPIDLTNLQYSIDNQISGTSILQNTLALLPAGAVHFDSVHLVNNFLIEGSLTASLINMDSPGSNGNLVLIDTSDALDLRVSLDKLDPVSATAIFPAQDLFNDTATASIYPPSSLLTAVHVSEGDIFMNAFSTIDDSVNLTYALPGAIDPNGSILQFLEVIPAAPPNSSVNSYVEIPVKDYTLDMTGEPGAMNVYNTFYTIFIGGIDSTGRIINLSLEDSVYVETGIKNLVTDRGYGFLGYDTLETQDVIGIEGFGDILGGAIDLKEAEISLNIENYIGTHFTVQIDELKSSNISETKDLTWNQLGFKFAIPPAQETTVGAKPNPGRLEIPMDNNSSNIQDLLEIRPDSLSFDIKAYMNLGQPNTDLSQFLYTDYGIESSMDLKIPLHLGLSDLFLGDSLDFNYSEIDPDNRVNQLSLKLIANNSYPFEAQVDLILFDANRQVLDTIFAEDLISSAPVDQSGISTGLAQSEVLYHFNSEQKALLEESKFIFLHTLLNTAPQQSVRLYSSNYLDLQLVADLRISTQ